MNCVLPGIYSLHGGEQGFLSVSAVAHTGPASVTYEMIPSS